MKSRPGIALLALVMLLVGVFLGGHAGWMPSWVSSVFTDQSKSERQFNDVLGLIEHNYYRSVDPQSLSNKGLSAAVASLKDPYSHYYPPAQQQEFDQNINPSVTGVGIEVFPVAAGLDVYQVFPGGPAAHARVAPGWVITAVNHRSIKGWSSTRSTNAIKGRSGTPVTLTLSHGSRQRTITVKRAQVADPVVMGNIVRVKGHKLGWIQYAQFTEGSAKALAAEVKKLQGQGAQGLILDLRSNPGGLVTEAINAASLFIPSGTIVTTRGRSQPTHVYTAKGDAIAAKTPVVVLANRGSASAAEIVTAALQQRRHAKVVGTRTYGKGVFQQSQTLPGGGVLDITVGEFFTPDGKNLGGAGVAQGRDLVRGPGIKPDYYVKDDPSSPGPAALHKGESVLVSELK
ncbi:MAG: S41 family peptidase [Solirubrobacterales bacterium]|nr:S41 family peptidase [Solirubrobacterales bacterium]